jgi:hypothetical protein
MLHFRIAGFACPKSQTATLIVAICALSSLAFGTPKQAPPANRPLSTDRPDTTESPFSVPKGMFQIEASAVDFTQDRRGTPSRAHQWLFAQINVKQGIATDADLQLLFNSYGVAEQFEGGESTRSRGFGDLTLRFKQNLLGNDSGALGLALMPYITFPSCAGLSQYAWAGGLIIPLATTLQNGWSVGVMAEVDLRDRSADGLGQVQHLHSATLGIPLTPTLNAYTELVSIASPTVPHQLSTNAGLTFQISSNLVIDAGCRIGLSQTAPDLGVFSGFSIRY